MIIKEWRIIHDNTTFTHVKYCSHVEKSMSLTERGRAVFVSIWIDYPELNQYNFHNTTKGGEIFETRNSTDLRPDTETAPEVIGQRGYTVHQRTVRRGSSPGQRGRVPEHRVRFPQARAAHV